MSDPNRTTTIEEGQTILHMDTDEFGIMVTGDGEDGLEITIDSRQGHIASLYADTEKAIRVGDLAHTFRQNSTGTRAAAAEFFDLLNAIDPDWVDRNGVTVEWLLG